MSRLRIAACFLFLAAIGGALRFPNLAQRPMHADEGVNADKFGVLLEQGAYEYSGQDFHGPTLCYLSLIPAKTLGLNRYADLSETSLRAVPAFLGVLLVVTHILLIPYFGMRAAAAAGMLTAVSPAMVYYSGSYIHEMLFVVLSFCVLLSLFRYCRQPRVLWAAAAGVFAGLLWATKETVILPVGCMLLAGLATVLVEKRRSIRVPGRHVALAVVAALVVAAVLLSSLFSHPRGLVDSLLAYRTYFARGAGIDTVHVHPWHYYFGLLLYFRTSGNPVWSEALIAVLAGAGAWAAFSRQGISGVNLTALRFLAFYTVFLLAVYSLLPYKAPWNALGFLHGGILLAGAGVAWLSQRCRTRAGATVLCAMAVAGLVHLGWLAWQSNTRYSSDPCNPWVYAHTGTDVFRIAGRMEELAAVNPEGHAMPVQVISRENLWPLPWYLRRFSQVQWSRGVPAAAPAAGNPGHSGHGTGAGDQAL